MTCEQMNQRLADFLRPPSVENAHRVHIVNTLVAVATSLLLFVAYRSVYSPDPIRLVDTAVTVEQGPDTGVIRLQETRKFEGLSEETIGVMRSVYAPNEPYAQVALEGGMFPAQFGEFTTHHTVELPPGTYGFWCLRTAYNWWPAWSQREYFMTVPDVCFYGVHPNDGTR